MPQIKIIVSITTTILAVLMVYNAYFIASETIYNLGAIVYSAAIFIGVIIAFIFYLLKRKYMLIFPLCFLLAVLPTKIIVDKGVALQKSSAIENGNKIFVAIDYYQMKYKKLPNNLSELEPVFIKKLPHYYLGLDPNNYNYHKRDSLNYSLSFSTVGANTYTCNSEDRKWFSHD